MSSLVGGNINHSACGPTAAAVAPLILIGLFKDPPLLLRPREKMRNKSVLMGGWRKIEFEGGNWRRGHVKEPKRFFGIRLKCFFATEAAT